MVAILTHLYHRVDKVLGFFSNRPTPSPEGECAPHPPWASGGGNTFRLREREGSQFGRGDRHCGTLGIYVLCDIQYNSTYT